MNVKIETQLLDRIKSLRDNFQNITFKFGQVQIERIDIEKLIAKINADEAALVRLYDESKTAEDKITDELISKYGEGSLDLNTGTYIKNQ
jgi:hypothetical protein